jgi:hypothetical protein
MAFFSGQGEVSVAAITYINNIPSVGAYRTVGNVPDFMPKFDVSKKEKKESTSGQRLTVKTILTENKSSFDATFDDWSKENLALATMGTPNTVASGTVTAEASPAGLMVGDIWALKRQKVSALVIKDSAATPATVSPTKYQLLDADFGTVKILDVTGLTLPLTASYSAAAVDSVSFFTAPIAEVAVRFQGVNTADGNRKCLVELYRVSLDPTKELGLISDDFEGIKMSGNLLVDTSKPVDAVMGQFGRIIYL